MSELAFDKNRLINDLEGTALSPWADSLGEAVLDQGHALKHGHLPGWEDAVNQLPEVPDCQISIENGVVVINGLFDEAANIVAETALKGLCPWRKGPFRFGATYIDTEWRSDWKWNRIVDHLKPLKNRTVLDVGCGSGYHLWRMRDAGAKLVLGIDPSLLYLKQFEAVQKYAQDQAVQFLPLPMEAMPESMSVFDTVFSMGVLYHRRDPNAHLKELMNCMKPGSELVLETLIIPGDANASLRLDTRYANMRNIYELPTQAKLQDWVSSAGFTDLRTVSVEITSRSEQRTTDWMPSHSLAQALDQNNSSQTIEGHPRPLRAVVVATCNT